MFTARLATLATLAALSIAPASAMPQTWEFVVTGYIFCGAGDCHFVSPFTLATLTLPSETSSGRTTYITMPVSDHPVTQGDDFSFHLLNRPPVSQTMPTDGLPPSLFGPTDFDISWNEVNAELLGALIIFNTIFDNLQIGVGISGSPRGDFTIASDSDSFCGGIPTQCTGTGFWHNASAISEPSSLVWLMVLLVGVGSWKVARLSAPGTPRTLGNPETPETTALSAG